MVLSVKEKAEEEVEEEMEAEAEAERLSGGRRARLIMLV